MPGEGGAIIESLAHELAEKGVRASHQRLRVLQYLREVGGHPTADGIHRRLVTEIPTLARATVYNTLHALVEAGLVRVVDVDGDETRYDAVLTCHGHFHCDACGGLADFAIDIDHLPVQGLSQHRITARSVIFRGVCPTCRGSEKANKE